MQAVAVTTTHEIVLEPQLKRKLLTRLKMYEELRTQKKAIEAAMDKCKGEVEAIREETGEQTLALNGYTVTLVAPIRKKFDEKKFVTIGGDIELFRMAHIDVTSRAYVKISVPGEKESE